MELKSKIEKEQQAIEILPLVTIVAPPNNRKVQELRDLIQEKKSTIQSQIILIESLKNYVKVSPHAVVEKLTCNPLVDTTRPRSRIQDLIALFRLRRVESSQTVQEVRILYFSFDFTKISNRRKWNQCMNVITKFVKLLGFYLSEPMPNQIFSHERMIRFDFSETGLKPLELNEKNADDFLIGLATLNYNIVCLCYSQDVCIKLDDTYDTLELLAKLCGSPSLGKSVRKKPEFGVSDVVQIHQQKVIKLKRLIGKYWISILVEMLSSR